jgi:DNA-binding response OmpR family regulator
LWTSAASSADVVVVEAQRDHRNALMAAIEGSTVVTRRRMVLLTWQLHWETIERALQLEIADFQPMPCRTEELVARMRAASVRAACRDWLFDFSEPDARSRTFEREGNCSLRLTVRERALYRVLAAREGEVVTRADLLAAVWSKGSHDPTASNIVDVYVRYLRVKLAAAMPDVGIETVKRVGYLLRRKGSVIQS